MRYIKANEILPLDLLEEIQRYADGVYLYIPRKPEKRLRWGSGSGYRGELELRDCQIRQSRREGMSISALAKKYHLSEKSISRILRAKE